MTKNKTGIQKRVDYLLQRIIREKGVNLKEDDYPHVEISKDLVSYNPELNYAFLREEDFDDGDILGEDAIGHPIRRNLRQYAIQQALVRKKSSLSGRIKARFGKHYPENADYQEDDPDVSEFFGYIGRKLLREIATPEDNLKFRKKRKQVPVPEDYKKHHQEGYKFAEQIDLSRIKDLNAFFSLSPEEVRARFFRANPQYDLDKPVPVQPIRAAKKPSGGNLETIVKFLIPGIILIFLISFLSKTSITGYVIATEPNKKILLSFITFFALILIIAILVIYKLKKKQK